MKVTKVSFMLLLVVFLVADVVNGVLSEELEIDGKSIHCTCCATAELSLFTRSDHEVFVFGSFPVTLHKRLFSP